MPTKQVFASIKLLSPRAVVSSVFFALGALWIVVEATAFFFSNQTWAQSINKYWWVFLFSGLVFGGVRAWPRLHTRRRIDGTDVEVVVQIGDIFSSSDSMIVGSNTTFETGISNGTISPKSVQGQFTNRYFASENDLHKIVAEELQKPVYEGRETFDFGTVVSIEGERRLGYFVAIAGLNEHKVANVEENDFLDALPRMWEDIRNRGTFGPVCCPIIGSGFSRLSLTRSQIVLELIKSFIVATVEAKFSERLTIFVSFDDFFQGHLDLKKITHALEHECSYAVTNRSTNPQTLGTPVGNG